MTLALQASEQTAWALREDQQRVSGMIEGLSVGVTLHAPDGAIHDANLAALHLLGTSARRVPLAYRRLPTNPKS